MKQFVDFPIMNVHNEIWNLVYDYDEKLTGKLPDKIKPFSEPDFNKHYSKIFTKRFINTILKIKSGNLYKTGEAESTEFERNSVTYKMYATFNKEARTLTLNLASKTKVRTEDGGESNVIYEVDILNNTTIKFRQVRLAG